MSDSWIIYSDTATNANYISFTDHGNEIFKLISSSVGLNQAAGGWDATGTNILLLTTNLPGGWFLETCTNITPPVTWNQTTNYTLSTNTGVITFTIPVNFSLTTCFFRLRTGASVGAIFSAPVSFNGGTIYPSNSWNLTTITNALASLGAGKHYWLGNSNGQALVTLSYSNGVVRYIRADN